MSAGHVKLVHMRVIRFKGDQRSEEVWRVRKRVSEEKWSREEHKSSAVSDQTYQETLPNFGWGSMASYVGKCCCPNKLRQLQFIKILYITMDLLPRAKGGGGDSCLPPLNMHALHTVHCTAVVRSVTLVTMQRIRLQ